MVHITTIKISDELHHYVKVNDMNLSKFVREALYEHSGQGGMVELDKLVGEVKDLEVQLSIKKAIVKEKQAEETKAAVVEAERLDELEKAKSRCKKCGNVLIERDLANNSNQYCKNCFWAGGHKEVMKNECSGA